MYYVHQRGQVSELATLEDLYSHFGISSHPGRQNNLRRAIDQESSRSFNGAFISTDPDWAPSVPKPFQGGVNASLDLNNATDTHAAVKRMYFDESTDQRTRNTIMDRYQHVVGPAVEDIRAQYEAADEDGKAVYVERYGHAIDF